MAFKIGTSGVVLLLLTLLLLAGAAHSFPAPSSPARIVNGFFSNAFPMLMKWFWSLKATTKTAISGKPMMRFESGYSVETVFDGSKLGIDPYSVEVLPDGDLLILDSANSNLYKISSSLSLYSRPKLISGSADGYSGHVDGRLRDARMNHPKGLTVDSRGNIYIADIDNMAIRKISDTGVTTIAGGRQSRKGGHVDGPSEDAKFSNDFDVVFLGSSCSLLVVDRGNKAIREIQLSVDACAYQYANGFPFEITVLLAAAFFGYMLGLLQRRIGLILSPSHDDEEIMKDNANPYQKSPPSMLPPLIPQEYDQEKQEETFFASLWRLVAQTGESFTEIRGTIFPFSKRKKQLGPDELYQDSRQPKYHNRYSSSSWPAVQESFVIAEGEYPPPPMFENRTPTPKKTYAFMSKDSEKMQQQLKQSRIFYSGFEGGDHNLQRQKIQTTKKHHIQNQLQHRPLEPQTYFEKSYEDGDFGVVRSRVKYSHER